MRSGDMDVLRRIAELNRAGFDGLCGIGSQRRRLARMEDEGLLRFIGFGGSEERDGDWPIWEMTDAGRASLTEKE
jgi:hypothetical protein